MGGVIENADNPTNIKRKDSPLTMADEVMVYKLRPSVKVRQHIVTPTNPGNIDPPIVGYDASRPVPDNLAAWIRDNATLTYDYTTDETGKRVTLPAVSAEEKIVIVGDSVTFGVGVRDEDTLPSQLQTLVGASRQIINLGVGGYKAWQAYQAALDSPDAKKGNTLVYIACMNDFNDTDPSGFDIPEMESWMKKFAALKESGHYSDVIIVLQSYQEVTFHHFLNRWPDAQVKKINEGFAYFDTISTGHGFTGINWQTMVKDYNASNRSMFAGMALYADHVHLSPAGNRLLAERLFETIKPDAQ
jgi:lysophospholipase L1-like esterase